MGTAIKHPVPNRVKPPSVIFDVRALQRSGQDALQPYSCTHLATLDVKGLR